MKKLHLNQIKNILSISKNKKGISIDQLYKSHPYEISFDNFKYLINSDEYIQNDNNLISLKKSYYSTSSFTSYEQSFYNINYLKTLFKEETNTIKLSIYKLLVDYPQMTYQELCNEMLRLYDVKLDIKQVSHYCMELMKIKLITSEQKNTGEKINRLNKVNLVYNNDQTEENTNAPNNSMRNNINFDFKLCHYPQSIFKFKPCETLSENKCFLSNRFSFVIDENEIKNNILFHLLLNKAKGLTGNEICFLCDFVGREKTLNKIIAGMEKKKDIHHKVMREGKKMEFVYFLTENAEICDRIKDLASYYINEHKHKEDTEKENTSEQSTVCHENLAKSVKVDPQLTESLSLDQRSHSFLITSSVNHFEELNENDYENVLSLLKKTKGVKFDQNAKTSEGRRKNIITYISQFEQSKNFSNSAFNRYIFVLNQIQEKKVLHLNEIKQLILAVLEKSKDYVIDRKTLKRILLNLEKMKLLKLLKFEMTMKNTCQSYLNEKEEIKQEKIIALRLDIDENDQALLDNVIEKIKPQKKSIPNSQLINIQKSPEYKSSQKIIPKFPEIKISLHQRNISLFVLKMNKIVKKMKELEYYMKSFIDRLKRIYSIKTHVFSLYEKRELINKANYPTEKLYSIIETQKQRSIILPEYIINNNTFETDINPLDDEDSKYSALMEYMSENSAKKILREVHHTLISKFKVKKEVSESFLQKKRKIDEGFSMVERSKFDWKKWNKLIDIYTLIKEIYFLPGITFYKLKRKMQISSEYEGAEKEILLYLKKMGIVKIEGKEKDFGDESNIYIDDNFKLFIDI